ncbi:carbohydrate ABC transporter permease [Gulosibacter sp. 10]|uniref:carbohydrate ABC transporter permease n=1 Tax=Gulosibacter sp. 10 TaxID=1255570 RepID=UPI00097E9073|nr:sugar ABC transporter permease [Gulosibacter sp. 10]SJM49494.1 Maltose/maltodextrin ABC transporter, permease protein MalF [Gulosibacter sp. 10]
MSTAETVKKPDGRTRGGPRRRRSQREAKQATWLIAPAMVVLALVIGYPIVSAIVQSFNQDRVLDEATGFFQEGGFAGVANYTRWLLQDCGGGANSCPAGTTTAQFWNSIGVTFLLTAVTVSLEVVIGFWMAAIMGRSLWGRGLLRAAVLVPWAIPTAVTAKLWAFIFAQNGIVNSLTGLDLQWTTGTWELITAVIIADVWKTTPFVALLILAGLQMIPKDVYDAAKIDGATRRQQFTQITLPLVKPALLVAVLFRLLDALRMYDLPAIMQGNTSGPATTMSLLVTASMREGQFSNASALSTIVFLIIFACAFIMVKVLGANAVAASQPSSRTLGDTGRRGRSDEADTSSTRAVVMPDGDRGGKGR